MIPPCLIVGFSGFWFRVPPAKPESRLPNPAEERQPTCRFGRLADLVKSPGRPVAKSLRRAVAEPVTRKTDGDSWKRQEEFEGRQRRTISTIPMLSESDNPHNCLPFVCDHTLANLLREHFFAEIAYRRIPSYTRHNCCGVRLLIG